MYFVVGERLTVHLLQVRQLAIVKATLRDVIVKTLAVAVTTVFAKKISLYNFFLIDVPEYEKDDASSFQCSCLNVDTEDRLSFEREMFTMVTYDLPQERAF